MKDRMTLGRAGDVRDLTADIAADPYATERVFAALDYECDRRREKNRVDAALRRLGKKERAFARAVLRGAGLPHLCRLHRGPLLRTGGLSPLLYRHE